MNYTAILEALHEGRFVVVAPHGDHVHVWAWPAPTHPFCRHREGTVRAAFALPFLEFVYRKMALLDG